jgi:hypothetical protein
LLTFLFMDPLGPDPSCPRRVATPGVAARPARGVEMLDVAMAEDVVAVRRAPFSGLYDQAS